MNAGGDDPFARLALWYNEVPNGCADRLHACKPRSSMHWTQLAPRQAAAPSFSPFVAKPGSPARSPLVAVA